jgi:hypothetical protein
MPECIGCPAITNAVGRVESIHLPKCPMNPLCYGEMEKELDTAYRRIYALEQEVEKLKAADREAIKQAEEMHTINQSLRKQLRHERCEKRRAHHGAQHHHRVEDSSNAINWASC